MSATYSIEEHGAISAASLHLIVKALVKVICRCVEAAMEVAKLPNYLNQNLSVTLTIINVGIGLKNVSFKCNSGFCNICSLLAFIYGVFNKYCDASFTLT